MKALTLMCVAALGSHLVAAQLSNSTSTNDTSTTTNCTLYYRTVCVTNCPSDAPLTHGSECVAVCPLGTAVVGSHCAPVCSYGPCTVADAACDKNVTGSYFNVESRSCVCPAGQYLLTLPTGGYGCSQPPSDGSNTTNSNNTSGPGSYTNCSAALPGSVFNATTQSCVCPPWLPIVSS
ncbi:hypothetical protein EON66_04005, partial [archaeon]